MTDHKYGHKGHIVDAFLVHIRGMTETDRDKVLAAWEATRDVWSAAWDPAEYARNGVWDPFWDVAAFSAGEIQDADLMRERGEPFVFLPMFGFADEQAARAALQPKEKTK